MKALSIRQPWASLIIYGFKDIENRSWNTNFRGRFMVHASKKFDKAGLDWVLFHFPNAIAKLPHLKQGGIIGSVVLADVVTESRSKWFEGQNYGFVLVAPTPCAGFIPMDGKLGFWEVPK